MKFRFLPAFVSVVTLATSSFALDPQLSIDGLEQRVDFWKKIFTEYGKDDVVLHDAFHVNLIYDVANDDNRREKTEAVRDALRELRAELETPEAWSAGARRIAEAVSALGLPMSKAVFDSLLENIHGQRGIKERFRSGIIRSGRHIAEFSEILEATGVPKELALLPLVESSFENVRSKAGAVGIWQFTRATGRSYMRISGNVDQRLDPVIATRAAARLLSDNYKALGEWPLAVTAYNHGRAGMLRAKREHGSNLVDIINDYRGPVFGYASMNFYAEFLAAVDVYNSYPTYFGELVLDEPVRRGPTIRSAETTLVAANGEGQYKVQKGDTLWKLAERFGTSIRSLMELNNLNQTVIYAGQILLVK